VSREISQRQWLVACAGLIAAPALWAMNTQLGEILPYAECRRHIPFTTCISLLALLLSGIAGALSWRRRARCGDNAGPVFLFIATVAAGTALVFAFVLTLQGVAGLLIDGCQR
jgi:hypothetical protein